MYPPRREDSWYINLNSNRSNSSSSNNPNHTNSMKILIACENSGVVRDAFQENIQTSETDIIVSCDLLPSSSDGVNHIQCSII